MIEVITSQNPNDAILIAFKILPIYNFLPNEIIHELISMLTPQDRIGLSHTSHYFRSLIVSPRCLSDLWLYIYHIPMQKHHNNPAPLNNVRSTFRPFMIFSNDPSPSHATSLPNTLATSTAMSSRQMSINTLFKTSTSNSSNSRSPISTSPKIKNNNSQYLSIKQQQQKYENDDEDKSNLSVLDKKECDKSQSTEFASETSLEHPSNPKLCSKIIYWPSYKQVLACDFPNHWRRKNEFYRNLCVLGRNCGGAHIRVFEVGMDRITQILSRISPMLLSLSFLNIHSIKLDSYAFS